MYARAWGWDEDQVDNISLHMDRWYLPINGVIEKDCKQRAQAAYEAAQKAANG